MNRSPLLVIFITVFIDLVGFGIVIPVLPYYITSENFQATPLALGFLLASYSVMQLIFTPVLGRLSDKHGRRPVLLLSLVGTGVGFLIMGAATTLTMLFAGRLLDGITGGNISTAQAYVADITTPENRARGMGMFGAAFGLGFIFGPAIGGVLSRWGISVPFYFAGALAFSNAVLLYFLLPETITAGHPARTVRRGWGYFFQQLKQRRLATVLAVYFLFVVAFSIMTTTFALYTMYRFGYDADHNGYLFAYIGILSAVVQGALIGRMVKRWGEVRLVVAGALILVSSLAVLPFIGPSPRGGLPALLLILAAFSTGNSLATPSLTSLASKSVGEAGQGGVLGVTQSAASLARIVGPIIGGSLIYSAVAPQHLDDHSLRVTFWTAAAIMFLAFLLAAYFKHTQTTEYAPAN
ncbi:MAG TPA: MFS transporter [Pyrinomonadaceae bacterium]|jgi:DHA1 family tetracycline resistance protein-like MFS transporter|nr:MFS transporter [Pyrinomonadaceae bacterium]